MSFKATNNDITITDVDGTVVFSTEHRMPVVIGQGTLSGVITFPAYAGGPTQIDLGNGGPYIYGGVPAQTYSGQLTSDDVVPAATQFMVAHGTIITLKDFSNIPGYGDCSHNFGFNLVKSSIGDENVGNLAFNGSEILMTKFVEMAFKSYVSTQRVMSRIISLGKSSSDNLVLNWKHSNGLFQMGAVEAGFSTASTNAIYAWQAANPSQFQIDLTVNFCRFL